MPVRLPGRERFLFRDIGRDDHIALHYSYYRAEYNQKKK
jgi:hypothetical protein